MPTKSIGAPIDKGYWQANNAGVRTQTAIDHFGTQKAVADALGITQPSVAEWGEYPPPLRQMQLHAATGGKLKPEPDCFPQRASA